MIDFDMLTLNHSYREILKLGEMLTKADIPHKLYRCYDGWQIEYYGGNRKRVCDAVEHASSIGSGRDLIEIMGLVPKDIGDEVQGYLKAEDVFRRINAHWNRKNKD